VSGVFLLLFEKAKLFDASKGTVSSWIIQIAYHRAMNRRQYLAHRQHYDAQELDEQQIGARPWALVDEITARDLLSRLRAQLSEEQRQTLELHFFEGYSLREIAEKTNQTVGNVRHHFYRGLERLRAILLPKKDR
jgi:RNA polymerase sigma-70 factor (ECF subfamily)